MPFHHGVLDRDPPERRGIPQGILQPLFTAITGTGWANGPLLLTIGVAPKTVVFEEAKTAADSVMSTIISKAGFPDIDVAVWEWTMTFRVAPRSYPSTPSRLPSWRLS